MTNEAQTLPDPLTVTTEDQAWRVHSSQVRDGHVYLLTVLTDLDREGDENAWAPFIPPAESYGMPYDTAEEAREVGRAAVLDMLGADVVTLEMCEGTAAAVAVSAASCGLPPSRWAFGQLAGLPWMLSCQEGTSGSAPRDTDYIGTWTSLRDAYTGMQGMLAVLSLLKQRQAGHADAAVTGERSDPNQ